MDLLSSTISQMRDAIEEERDEKRKPSPIRISNLERNGLQYVCSSTKRISGDAICSIRGKEYSVDLVNSSGVLYISGLEDLGDEKILEAYLYQDESALTQKILDEFTMLSTNYLHNDLFKALPLKEGDNSYEDESLSTIQKEAVTKALANDTLLVVGPAGTGKTKTIVATIKAMVDKGLRILVCSHANLAVEGAMESLVKTYGESFERDDLVCEIKTKSQLLKEYSVGSLSKDHISFLEDEMDELEEITKNLLASQHSIKKNMAPIEKLLRSSDAMLANLQNEEKQAKLLLLAMEKKRQSLKERVDRLNSNKLLALFTQGSKREKLALELEEVAKKVFIKEDEVKELKQRLLDYKEKFIDTEKIYKEKGVELKKIDEDLAKISSRKKEIRNEIENLLSENYYKSAKVAAVTLMKAAINTKVRDSGFDVLIVDEVSMATIPALLLAMQAVNKKVILFGDPMQLPPIAKSKELKNSIFDILEITDSFLAGYIHQKCVFLDTQYRCHPEIARLSSDLFYGGTLKNGRAIEDNKKAMYIKNTHGMGAKFSYQKSEGGYINTTHQKVVLKQVKNALRRGQRSIGVVCPFRAQANAINELYNYELAHQYPDAHFLCSTIHSFQGQEKDVVIFDFMYGYSPSNQNIPKMLTGDMTSTTAKLLNVATTRAKDFFVLVCDLQYINSVFKNTEGSERLAIFQWLKAIENLAFLHKDDATTNDTLEAA